MIRNQAETSTLRAEGARTPHDPRLTAYEAGRWYALNGRTRPAGATAACREGYADAEAAIDAAEVAAALADDRAND